MALSARELVYFVRVSDQATRTLRHIGSDFATLSKAGKDFGLAQDRVNAQRAKAMKSLAEKQAALTSLQSGTRGLRLQQQANAIESSRGRLLEKRQAITNKIAAAERTIQRSQTLQYALQKGLSKERLRTVESAVAHGTPILGGGTVKQRSMMSAMLAERGALDTLEAQALATRNLGAAETKLSLSAAKLSASEIEQAKSIALATEAIRLQEGEVARLTGELAHLAEAQRMARWDRVAAGSRIFSHVGRSAQIGGLAVGVGLGVLAKGAADFGQQASLAATQAVELNSSLGKSVTATQRVSDVIQAGILKQMPLFTASAEEMTKSAYDIYSSMTFVGNQTTQTARGLQFLNLANEAAVAGMTPLTDVTHAAVTVFNDFGNSTNFAGRNVGQMRGFMNRAFAAVRFGRMTFQEFTQSLATTAPAAKAANQSFDILAGTMAFLTRRIPSVRMSGVAFARLLEVFQRPEMIAGLRKFGVSITDAHHRMKPLPEILDMITKRFPGLEKGTKNPLAFFKEMTAAGGGGKGLSGTIQARRAFTFLTRDIKAYQQILGQTMGDNNEFAKSLRVMRDTPGARWQMFVRSMQALGIQIGGAVTPILLNLIAPLRKAVEWFNKLPPGRRDEMARWLAYGAAIALVGGTFLTIVGSIGRAIATFQMMKQSTRLLIAGPVGLIALGALLIASGHAADVLGKAMDFATGSFHGFLITSALVVAMVLRLRNALVGLTVAGEAGTGVGLLGGLTGGLRNAKKEAGYVNAAFRVEKMTAMERGAGRFAASLAGAGSAVSMLPGGLAVVGGIIAATAISAGLWKLHMMGVEQHAERIAKFQAQITALAENASRSTQKFGSLGLNVRDVERQKLAVADLNAQIKDMRAQIRDASSADRPGLQRQLRGLILDRADATDRLREANHKANVSFNAVTEFAVRQITTLQALGNAQKNLRRERGQLREVYQQMLEHPSAAMAYTDRINTLREGIKNLKHEVDVLGPAAAQAQGKFRAAFEKNIRLFQATRDLPQKITPVARETLLRTALSRRRMLTLPEMRQVIRAVIHPGSVRKLPRDIQRAINRARIQVRVETRITDFQKKIDRMTRRKGIPLPMGITLFGHHREANKAKSAIANIFRRRINQPIHLGPIQPGAIGLGRDITAGISRGVGRSNALNRAVQNVVDEAIVAGIREAQAHSPSRRTQREIGVPLVQGIEVGIKQRMPFLRKLAENLVVNLIPALKDDQKPNIRNMTRGLTAQLKSFQMFNAGLARLQQRGVPKQLLTQLGELGAEGAPIIAQLVGSTDKDLNNYVKIWQKTMKQVSKATDDTKKSTGETMAQMAKEAADNMTQMYEQMKQQNTEFFGTLFQGAYIQSDAVQAKLDWGLILNTSDLIKDLRSQDVAFEKWQRQLSRLSRQGLPKDMIAQLRELGPEASKQLGLILSMTPKQRKQYIALWKRAQRDINRATTQDFNRKVMEWRKYGRKASLEFMRGMRDESSVIRKQMEKIFLAFLHKHGDGTLATNKSKKTQGDTHFHEHTTVNAHHTESLSTTLAKHRFRQKHRPRRNR